MNSPAPEIVPPEPPVIREAAARALGEDRGPADITSMAFVPEDAQAVARIVTRQPCVLAGLPVAERVFIEVDPTLSITMLARDGQTLAPGEAALEVRGAARAILTGERSALNFLQQLSAVATKTRAFVDAVAGTKTIILDTRKTIPGQRALQKYAVRCGGGRNHRMGLYDMFLVKDNHRQMLAPGASWSEAVARARAMDPDAKVELEADTLEQVAAMADSGADWILLDNMTNEQMREAVTLLAGRIKTEASGNMSLERARSVAETGVDAISVGALTHTIAAVDLSLEMDAA